MGSRPDQNSPNPQDFLESLSQMTLSNFKYMFVDSAYTFFGIPFVYTTIVTPRISTQQSVKCNSSYRWLLGSNGIVFALDSIDSGRITISYKHSYTCSLVWTRLCWYEQVETH